jgi:hypothetical protein
VFEIGSSLREARVRRGIDLPRAEADTHIRTRYLRALEDERFDQLPAPAYAKGFLRSYADYLGLDSDRFVDEFNSRFTEPEPPVAPTMLEPHAARALRPYLVGAAVVLLAFGVLAWGMEQDQPTAGPPVAMRPPLGGTAVNTQPKPRATPLKTTATHPAHRPAHPTLVVRATGDRCWISVHQGDEFGAIVWEGTLTPGEVRRFKPGRLWIRIGAPWNLRARLGKRALQLPPTVSTVLVTRNGLSTLSSV